MQFAARFDLRGLLRACPYVLCAASIGGCATLFPSEPLGRSELVGRQLAADIAEVMANNHVYETAVPLLQQGIAEDPNNPRLHRVLGQVLRDRGVYDQSLQEMTVAYNMAPADADTAAGMGVLYDLMQRPVMAEAWHRHALDIDPDKAEFYNNLGFSMYLQQRYYESVGAFHESLRRNPNQQRVYNNLGFALARLDNQDAALRAFQQGGSRAAAMANLGVSYEMLGDMTEARRCYTQALKLDHRLETARRNLHNLDMPNDVAESGPHSALR